jgi:hypothetical protein
MERRSFVLARAMHLGRSIIEDIFIAQKSWKAPPHTVY